MTTVDIPSARRAIASAFLIWVGAFIAIATIGGSLVMDLTGTSNADRYVMARWSFSGLRLYLWLEAAVLIAIVAALGWHVITVGLAVTRGDHARLFGIDAKLRPQMPNQLGYIFVVLGAALVVLSLTTLVLFNSCRYMRIV